MSWEVSISVDPMIYPLGVVQRAAYALARTLMIQVSQTDNDLNLLATPTVLAAGTGTAPSEHEARELILRSLNDFALRERIQTETAGLREILATAALRGAGM